MRTPGWAASNSRSRPGIGSKAPKIRWCLKTSVIGPRELGGSAQAARAARTRVTTCTVGQARRRATRRPAGVGSARLAGRRGRGGELVRIDGDLDDGRLVRAQRRLHHVAHLIGMLGVEAGAAEDP